MSAGQPKQYLSLAGHPMLWHAIRAFERSSAIVRSFVVLAPDDGVWDTHDWHGLNRLVALRCGGPTRAASVLNGLLAMQSYGVAEEDWILVHDAARPCLSGALLTKLLAEAGADPVGGLLAAPVADTLKRADGGRHILETVSRECLWAAQTPQMFRYGLLRRALEQAGDGVTDEASAVEALGLSPRLVESDPSNLKVTFPGDQEVAEWRLAKLRAR